MHNLSKEAAADGGLPETTRDPVLRSRLLFLTGLALRLAVVAITWRHATPAWFFGQASELGRLANGLLAGHGFSSPFPGVTGPTAFMAPGYPALVAAVFAVFHPFSMGSAVAITVMQALFAAATVVPMMRLGERLLGVKTANLAGAFWTFSPALWWVPTIFWETSLSILLATTMLWMAMRMKDRPTRSRWMGLGTVAAGSLWVNPSLLTIVFCCFAWAMWKDRAHGAGAPALGLAMLALLCAPWPIRNARELHAWIPLRSNMGYELWQGNRLGSDGLFDPKLHPNVNRGEAQRWEALGELAYMREKSTLAKEAIAAEPGRFVELTVIRVLRFWSGTGRDNSWLMVLHLLLSTGCGVAGAALAWRRKRGDAMLLLLPLLLFPLPYYITHPDFRFRLVIDPVLLLLTAYALTEGMAKRKNRKSVQRTSPEA